MKRYRKWFFTGLIMLAAELCFVALFNYVVDPRGFFRYGTWRHDVLHQFIEPDKNFIKTRYVALNPQRYNCLIFGSSRVNAIDGRLAKNAVCYNMTFGQGLPRNYLDSLRYLVTKQVRPKLVLIGLDEFSYKYDPAEHTDFLRHPYPPAVHQNRALFYLKYLVRYSSRSMKEPLEGFEGKRQPIRYDHYGTGLEMPDPAVEKAIEADPITYAKDAKFREPFITPGDRMDAALEEIRETVDLLNAHGIPLIVFINPIQKETLPGHRPGQIISVRKRIEAKLPASMISAA